MRLSLFTNDDVRENVLKHIEVAQPLNIGDAHLFSGMDERGATVRSPVHLLGFAFSRRKSPPLLPSTISRGSLSPSQIPYNQLTAEVYDGE